MEVYVIANLVFGSYIAKSKAAIEDFNEQIIEKWNSIITNQDYVYVFGAFGGKTRKETREVISKLRGHIHICNYKENKIFTKNEWYSWNIERIWDNIFYDKKDMKRIIFTSIDNYNYIAQENDYGIIWNKKENIVYQNNKLSIDAKYWDYTPILLKEIPNIIDRLKDFENMEDNKCIY